MEEHPKLLTPERITQYLLREQALLTAYVYSITHNYHLAEDVFQEVCVKAVGRPEVFESVEHLTNWSRVAAKNHAITLIRAKEGRYTGLSTDLLAIIERDWSTLRPRADDRSDALSECLDSLPPKSRRIIAMRYFESCSGEEIARFMGAKTDSAYQAISRIHKLLRDCVQKRLEAEA